MKMHLFTSKPPTDPNDDYYRCLCGVHVHSFVFGLSIFEIVVGFAMLFALFAVDAILLAPFGVIAICLGLLLMWGNRKMVWWAYVLEMCQWVCSAFSNFLITGLIFFYGFAAFFVNLDFAFSNRHQSKYSHDKFENRAFLGLLIILLGVLHMFVSVVFAYFTCSLVRGFQYVYKFGRTHQKLEEKMEYY